MTFTGHEKQVNEDTEEACVLLGCHAVEVGSWYRPGKSNQLPTYAVSDPKRSKASQF